MNDLFAISSRWQPFFQGREREEKGSGSLGARLKRCSIGKHDKLRLRSVARENAHLRLKEARYSRGNKIKSRAKACTRRTNRRFIGLHPVLLLLWNSYLQPEGFLPFLPRPLRCQTRISVSYAPASPPVFPTVTVKYIGPLPLRRYIYYLLFIKWINT